MSWPPHDPRNPAGAPAGLTLGDLGNYAPDRENPYSQELFGETSDFEVWDKSHCIRLEIPYKNSVLFYVRSSHGDPHALPKS